jgi:hypothetical protein
VDLEDLVEPPATFALGFQEDVPDLDPLPGSPDDIFYVSGGLHAGTELGRSGGGFVIQGSPREALHPSTDVAWGDEVEVAREAGSVGEPEADESEMDGACGPCVGVGEVRFDPMVGTLSLTHTR